MYRARQRADRAWPTRRARGAAGSQVVAGEPGPHEVGVGRRIPQHASLEQGPRHVEHDAAVPARSPSASSTESPNHRCCQAGSYTSSATTSATASVNGSLSGQSRKAGRVRMAARCTACPVSCRARSGCQAPDAIGREDPRLDRRRPRAERRELHRVLPFARLDVEVHPQPGRRHPAPKHLGVERANRARGSAD